MDGLSLGAMVKKSSMLFFSDGRDHYSHRVRIVLAEKGVTVEVIEASHSQLPEEVRDLNPYGTLPTLVDRDLVLYEPSVMMEYLDERFPHPPLLPVYPVARAQSRLWIYRIQKDWCGHADVILDPRSTESQVEESRQTLRDSLIAVSPIFSEKKFFMSSEFSLVDCCVAPLIWRLELLGIEIPEKQVKHLAKYAKAVFSRDAFQVSLSDFERDISRPF